MQGVVRNRMKAKAISCMIMDMECTIRSLTKDEIPLILDLQDTVISGLQNKKNLRQNTWETISFCFEHPHFVWGIFDGEQLSAVSVFVDAAGSEEDLSLHLKKHFVTKPINYKLILVHPQYRGRGWQRLLFQISAALAKEMGYEQIIATVSPENTYSYHNMIQLGMKEDHREEKYGGLLRAVMVLEIQKEKDFSNPE